MPTKGPKASKAGKKKAEKGAEAYEHEEEKLLLRPDVGLQPSSRRGSRPRPTDTIPASTRPSRGTSTPTGNGAGRCLVPRNTTRRISGNKRGDAAPFRSPRFARELTGGHGDS